MTTEKTLTAADIIATFEARKAAMMARNIPLRTYVLFWDNGLCVGLSADKRDGFATGFEHAGFFGDREAAKAWQRRYRIRNGKGEEPRPVLAFNERERAMAELDMHIATINSMAKEG